MNAQKMMDQLAKPGLDQIKEITRKKSHDMKSSMTSLKDEDILGHLSIMDFQDDIYEDLFYNHNSQEMSLTRSLALWVMARTRAHLEVVDPHRHGRVTRETGNYIYPEVKNKPMGLRNIERKRREEEGCIKYLCDKNPRIYCNRVCICPVTGSEWIEEIEKPTTKGIVYKLHPSVKGKLKKGRWVYYSEMYNPANADEETMKNIYFWNPQPIEKEKIQKSAYKKVKNIFRIKKRITKSEQSFFAAILGAKKLAGLAK